MKEEFKFKESSIKYQLNVSPYREKLNNILVVGHSWRKMKEEFIDLINSITECTENNRKQAIAKIRVINSENNFYKVVGTYLSGYKLIS